MTAGPTDWPAALDALEEWGRRTRAARAEDAPADPPALPTGRVPAELRVRALALLDGLQAAEAELLRRREQLSREQAYTS